jgi:ring-1,2-phenylacetyl-CoA epoxidase subunit PaaD
MDTIDYSPVWQILDQVTDPEVPVLSIIDLGIVRELRINDHIVLPNDDLLSDKPLPHPLLEQPKQTLLEITITPTYSGCPAMDTITADIVQILNQNGWHNVQIKTTLSPPWTSDWLSERGRQRLKAYGIAPPAENTTDKSFLTGKKRAITCPFCNTQNTELISQFGSTACKALYRCKDCLEPFDYFKCH